MTDLFYDYVESPIGLVEIGGTAGAVTSLNFVESSRKNTLSNPCLEKAAAEIAEYFEQGRQRFTCEISLAGTPFQLRVWQQLLTVAYGCTASYKDIAVAVGNPQGVRAVGAANGKNPVSLIVPCHRIIGSNGKLTGYGGGLWRKEWLLRHAAGSKSLCGIKTGGSVQACCRSNGPGR